MLNNNSGRKVIDHLTDVIKELNVPCAEPPVAEPSAAERQADAAALLRGLLNELESHDADAHAAEHSATADKSAKHPPTEGKAKKPVSYTQYEHNQKYDESMFAWRNATEYESLKRMPARGYAPKQATPHTMTERYAERYSRFA